MIRATTAGLETTVTIDGVEGRCLLSLSSPVLLTLDAEKTGLFEKPGPESNGAIWVGAGVNELAHAAPIRELRVGPIRLTDVTAAGVTLPRVVGWLRGCNVLGIIGLNHLGLEHLHLDLGAQVLRCSDPGGDSWRLNVRFLQVGHKGMVVIPSMAIQYRVGPPKLATALVDLAPRLSTVSQAHFIGAFELNSPLAWMFGQVVRRRRMHRSRFFYATDSEPVTSDFLFAPSLQGLKEELGLRDLDAVLGIGAFPETELHFDFDRGVLRVR